MGFHFVRRACRIGIRFAAVLLASTIFAVIIYYTMMIILIIFWGVIDLVGTEIVERLIH